MVELTEKQQIERHRLVMKIMCLAYAFEAHTKHIVFIDWSGHVSQLQISFRESKTRWQTELAEMNFYTSNKYETLSEKSKKDPNIWLKNKVEVLKEAMERLEVPYEYAERVADTTYRHYF